MSIRIAKFIADSGAASRRSAEVLIQSGVVTVDGVIVDSPVFFVMGNEDVRINGVPVTARAATKIFAFHKPINTMTTANDPAGRRTVYDCLPPPYKNLKYIGRLDFQTTGLLLLTNDGDAARKLTLPSSHIPRVYIASTSGTNPAALDRARTGITVDGIHYRPMIIDVLGNGDLRVTVTEGKKNEVRIVLAACGWPVRKLHRVSFGPIELGNLSVGEIVELEQKRIDVLLNSF